MSWRGFWCAVGLRLLRGFTWPRAPAWGLLVGVGVRGVQGSLELAESSMGRQWMVKVKMEGKGQSCMWVGLTAAPLCSAP